MGTPLRNDACNSKPAIVWPAMHDQILKSSLLCRSPSSAWRFLLSKLASRCQRGLPRRQAERAGQALGGARRGAPRARRAQLAWQGNSAQEKKGCAPARVTACQPRARAGRAAGRPPGLRASAPPAAGRGLAAGRAAAAPSPLERQRSPGAPGREGGGGRRRRRRGAPAARRAGGGRRRRRLAATSSSSRAATQCKNKSSLRRASDPQTDGPS